MKRIGMIITGILMAVNMFSGVAYAGDSSDRLKKAADIIDVLDEDNDDKHKDHPGNSKKGRDNHGQNKKKKK